MFCCLINTNRGLGVLRHTSYKQQRHRNLMPEIRSHQRSARHCQLLHQPTNAVLA